MKCEEVEGSPICVLTWVQERLRGVCTRCERGPICPSLFLESVRRVVDEVCLLPRAVAGCRAGGRDLGGTLLLSFLTQ